MIYENNKLTANLTVNEAFSTSNTEIMKFSTIEVEKAICIDGELKTEIISVAVLKGTEEAEIEAYAARARLIKAQCEFEPVASVPAWWQTKLNSDVPQIVCVFRNTNNRNYHNVTIPHPKQTDKPNSKILPEYVKGNWQGMVVCVDNSKFIINCVSKPEAERMCNIAVSKIDPVYLEQPPRVYIGERKGQGVAVDPMKPTSIEYFERGLKHLTPNWRFKIPPSI